MTQKQLTIPEGAVEFGSIEFWLVAASVVVLCGLLGGGLTEGVKKYLLVPWAKARGVKNAWWWDGLLWCVCIVLGAGVGVALGEMFWGSILVGSICGVIGGGSATWIVRIAKRKGKEKLEAL